MSVAEKLKAEGRVEGEERGLLIGKILAFEEFLGNAPTTREKLGGMPLAELEGLHSSLHCEYEARFKNH